MEVKCIKAPLWLVLVELVVVLAGVAGGGRAGERVVLLGGVPALVTHRDELLRVRPAICNAYRLNCCIVFINGQALCYASIFHQKEVLCSRACLYCD